MQKQHSFKFCWSEQYILCDKLYMSMEKWVAKYSHTERLQSVLYTADNLYLYMTTSIYTTPCDVIAGLLGDFWLTCQRSIYNLLSALSKTIIITIVFISKYNTCTKPLIYVSFGTICCEHDWFFVYIWWKYILYHGVHHVNFSPNLINELRFTNAVK